MKNLGSYIKQPRARLTIAGIAIIAFVTAAAIWRASESAPTMEAAAKDSSRAASGSGLAPRKGADPVASSADEAVDPRAAIVRVRERQWAVVPNARGEFPRIPVPAHMPVVAAVPFPGAAAGEAIAVQAEDGGVLLGGAAGGSVTIDEHGRAQVGFTASAGEGMHRVTLRRGGELRVLEFWVGPDQPVLARR